MASIFGVDPEKFKVSKVSPSWQAAQAWQAMQSGKPCVWLDSLRSNVTISPMIGTGGKLWTCGRPGQMRCVGLTPEAAYRSWSRMQ